MAYKFRLYPTKEQETLLNKTFGCCRLVYNERLQERIELYIENILPIKNNSTQEERNKIRNEYESTQIS